MILCLQSVKNLPINDVPTVEVATRRTSLEKGGDHDMQSIFVPSASFPGSLRTFLYPLLAMWIQGFGVDLSIEYLLAASRDFVTFDCV